MKKHQSKQDQDRSRIPQGMTEATSGEKIFDLYLQDNSIVNIAIDIYLYMLGA